MTVLSRLVSCIDGNPYRCFLRRIGAVMRALIFDLPFALVENDIVMRSPHGLET